MKKATAGGGVTTMPTKAKRLLTALLAVICALALMLPTMALNAEPAYADDPEGNGGTNTITVENPQASQTYTLYKLFDATTNASRQGSTGTGASGIAYDYTMTDGKSLDTTYTYTGVDGQSHSVKGTDFFNIDAAGNVTAKADLTTTITTEAFQQWAKQFGTQVTTKVAPNPLPEGSTLVFSNLTDGYYFLTSTMGSLVTVTSVAPAQTVRDKNSQPDVTKSVSKRTSSVGDEITYTIEISLSQGASNVVFHDIIDNRLTLGKQSSAKVTLDAAGNTPLDPAYYTFNRWDNTAAAAASGAVRQGDNITLSFNPSYLGSLQNQTTIYLTYTATLSSQAGINMPNEAFVTYGDQDTKSTSRIVYESSFNFNVLKLDGSNNNAALNGAKFVLSTKDNLGNLTEDNYTTHSNDLLSFTDGGVYDPSGSNKLFTANNQISFSGLNNDEGPSYQEAQPITYYLYEVTAPNGYSKLAEPVDIQIMPVFSATTEADHGTHVESYTVKYKTHSAGADAWTDAVDDQGNTATAVGVAHNVQIANQQGTPLPSTGGMGTTILYVIGAILVVGAAVTLIVRKRMHSQR